jgi:hypothetical protein
MKKMIVSIIILNLFTFAASAQKLKGDVNFLNGQKNVNIVFDFKGVTIDGDSEEEYVKERMADEKTPEEAESWKAKWEGAARENFKNIFIKYCNDELKNRVVGYFPDAEYTIVMKIQDIDPGNFAGPFSNPAKLKSVATFVKTGEEKELASIVFKKMYHPSGLSPIEFDRILLSFGETGKGLGKLLQKKVK